MLLSFRQRFIANLCSSGATKIHFSDIIRIYDITAKEEGISLTNPVLYVDGPMGELPEAFKAHVEAGANPFKDAELQVKSMLDARRKMPPPPTGMELDTSEPQPNAEVLKSIEKQDKKNRK